LISPTDESKWQSYRPDFPVLSTCIYTNTGTLGPSPTPVTQAFIDSYLDWQAKGPGRPAVYRQMHTDTDIVRAHLATFLNVTPGEIALTANSTDAINIVANGLDWHPDDEVIISDQEHEAGLFIWLWLQQRGRLRLRIAKLGPDARSTLDNIAAKITPHTRLIAMSHVSCQTGVQVPAKEICEMAHAAGAQVMFDGAQATGQFPIDLRDMGVDYYAMNGHKWLLGPAGTGALYIRGDRLPELQPSWVGGWSEAAVRYAEDGYIEMLPDAHKFEYATRNFSLFVGLDRALSYLEGIGLDAIRARELYLTDIFASRLSQRRGIEVISPTEERSRTGLVSVKAEGIRAEDGVKALWERYRVVARPVKEYEAIRFSASFFNTPDEMIAAADAVAAMAGGR